MNNQMSKRKSARNFETEKRMEIKQTGYARMTVSDDEYLELPLESGILNMHGWKITAMEESKGEYNIYAEPTGNDYEKIGCLECGTVGQWYKHGTRKMRIVDLPVHGKQSLIIVERQRWRCKACASTVQENLPYVYQTRSMTERVLAYIELKALESTFAEVSREIGVSESTVSNIFQDFIATLEARRKLETPRVLGIDEIYIGKQSRAVFTDIDKRKPIDMLPVRTKVEVKKWLETLDTKKVEVVIMDMWNPYRDAVKEVIPHAVIVVDKFHVVRMANDALNRVRKDIRSKMQPNQRIQLKRDRYVMLRRRDQLDAKDTFLLETWLGSFEELGHAYAAKEMFCDIWESENPRQAQAKYREWLLWIADKKLQGAFADLVRAMTNWHDEIFAHFKHRYTNAYTEAMNGILKIINRNGRGYGFKALRAKVIYSALRREEDNADPKVTTYDDLIDGDYQAAWFAIYGEDIDDDDSTSFYQQLPFNWR